MRKIIVFFVLLLLIPVVGATEIFFFNGQGCPHCAKLADFLEVVQENYPELEIRSFEVYYDAQNSELFGLMANAYGKEVSGVPALFIGDEMIVGFAPEMAGSIDSRIADCIKSDCPSPASRLDSKGLELLSGTTHSESEQVFSFGTGGLVYVLFVILIVLLSIAVVRFAKRR